MSREISVKFTTDKENPNGGEIELKCEKLTDIVVLVGVLAGKLISESLKLDLDGNEVLDLIDEMHDIINETVLYVVTPDEEDILEDE